MKHYEFIGSSALKQAWYTESQDLVVQTHGGDNYQFIEVPEYEWDGLITTSSPGRYWAYLRDKYGPSNPILEEPREETSPEARGVVETKTGQEYLVTVDVSGRVVVTVTAETIYDALDEVHETFNNLAGGSLNVEVRDVSLND